MNEKLVTLKCDERSIRALSFAVDFTLEKWTGQGEADQELLLALKPYLHGCVLEFMFDLEQ